MRPSERYQQDVQLGGFCSDPQQLHVLTYLDELYDELIDREHKPNLWAHIKALFRRAKDPVRGLYLWGGVGIGKTYLMDSFFECLPIQRKLRMHFHRFMQQTHVRLQALQGHKDPLPIIAREIAAKTRILCFDEFYVSDIADAMLLGGLFRALLDEGVTLVATSNIPPSELYRNGLQRELFLPAIATIEAHCEVIHLQSMEDYRLRTLQQSGVYFYPLDHEAAQSMRDSFAAFAHGGEVRGEPITIEGRGIQTIRYAHKVIWFDFMAICNVPRSQMDYLEIARSFHTVLVSNVVQIQENQDNLIRNFINLVDIFYDNNVKLIVSAETSYDALYPSGRLRFDFDRTQSRLFEMQSHAYLSRPHKL